MRTTSYPYSSILRCKLWCGSIQRINSAGFGFWDMKFEINRTVPTQSGVEFEAEVTDGTWRATEWSAMEITYWTALREKFSVAWQADDAMREIRPPISSFARLQLFVKWTRRRKLTEEERCFFRNISFCTPKDDHALFPLPKLNAFLFSIPYFWSRY